MDKFRGTARLFFLWFIILSPRIPTTAGNEGQGNDVNKQKNPSLVEMVTDTFSLLSRSYVNSWDKVKTIINLVQIKLFPPNLDFRSGDEARDRGSVGSDGVGGKVKEAVGKSFGSSKVTVEECAKSAAKVVEEAACKTTEKVKESMLNKQESDDAEL